jgi:lysozyme family protein
MDNFSACLSFTLEMEGGYTNNPNDPGNWTGGHIKIGQLRGTKCGISAASHPDLDIQNLSLEAIRDIYYKDYFMLIQGDKLQLPLAMVAFDAAVNAGVKKSIVWLQQSLKLQEDGICGPQTLSALMSGNPLEISRGALARRLDFYMRSRGWDIFGLGWAGRIIKLAQAIV